MKNFELVKLSQKTAKTLIQREIGLSAARLEQTKIPGSITSYTMSIGSLGIKVENDWFTSNGRIKLTITNGIGGNVIQMYFHPDTLNRDFGAEDAEKQDAQTEARNNWVFTHGTEYCHKAVDRIWEGR